MGNNLKGEYGNKVVEVVKPLLQNWSCQDSVFGMLFDTTSANTDKHKQACTSLEKELGRALLKFACR